MKLLLTGAFSYTDEQMQMIKELGNDYIFIQDEKEELDINEEEIEGIVCNSFFLYHNIEKYKNLKFIQLTSSGLDRVPLDYIKEHDIKLFNARGVYSIPMAEWTICKILDVYKKSFVIYENQKNSLWEKQRDILELNGKTATIVGFGSVGQEIAKRLYVFGVNIIAVDKFSIQSDVVSKQYLIEQLNESIKFSDIIILTLPLTNETEGLFNKDLFNSIDSKPLLINIARGKIINTNDLIRYHEKFSSIILDVFEEEPLDKNNELWKLDNAIITPHNSFISENNNKRLFQLIKDNIIKYKKEV